YVPRWQSEPLAGRATELLPESGVALDICTGSGAMAAVLAAQRPHARVVASDLSPEAVACARRNGIETYQCELFDGLPHELRGVVDVVVSVPPYVPTDALRLLPRDTLTREPTLSYDGGRDGLDVARRIVTDSLQWLRRGGYLLMELGGDQLDALRGDLEMAGLVLERALVDEDGDLRGVEAALAAT
ncbi:MAG TPA: methyltransferase, partial [Acidimicrobiales bacterium]|nr:methyltransferase [Acidimicrobiales bacterium]